MSLLTTTVFSASVAVGSRRLPLEEHPDPRGEREPVRAAGHQQEGVQEDPGRGEFNDYVERLSVSAYLRPIREGLRVTDCTG